MPMTSAMCVHAASVCKAASSSRHLPHLPTQAAKLPPCHHATTSCFCWQVEDERSAVLERLKVRVTVSLWKSKVKVVKQFLSEATGKTWHTKAVCESSPVSVSHQLLLRAVCVGLTGRPWCRSKDSAVLFCTLDNENATYYFVHISFSAFRLGINKLQRFWLTPLK